VELHRIIHSCFAQSVQNWTATKQRLSQNRRCRAPLLSPTSGSSPSARTCAHRPQWRPSVAEVYLLLPDRFPVPGRYLFHDLITRPTTDARAPLMPRIMIRCRQTKKAIPTGLTTELVILDSLSIPVDSLILTLKVRCRICGSKHKWNYKDAWVEDEK
jgi:hypothetical protein